MLGLSFQSNDVVCQIVLIFSFIVDMCVKHIHSDAVLIHHYFNCPLKKLAAMLDVKFTSSSMEEKQYLLS